MLRSHSLGAGAVTDAMLISDIERLYAMFHRVAEYSWSEYMIATTAELDEERMWAKARPGVRDRVAGKLTQEQKRKAAMWKDHPDSFLSCLNIGERLRL